MKAQAEREADGQQTPTTATTQAVDPGGAASQAQASELAASAPPYPGIMLRLGSSGPPVVTLQTLLNGHGAGLTPDGAFGPLTRQAVVGFQQGAALDVDGIVGPATWGSLIEDGGPGPTPGGTTGGGDTGGGGGPLVETPPGGTGAAPPSGGHWLAPDERQALAGSLRTAGDEMSFDGGGPAAQVGPTVSNAAHLIEQGGPAEDQALSSILAAIVRMPESGAAGPVPAGPEAQVAVLDFLDTHVTASVSPMPPKIAAWLGRVRSMRAFYASMTGIAAAKPGDMTAQQPVSSKRQAAVGAALAQVGKVSAKGPLTDVDDDGKAARQGWRTLTMIFDGAYGGYPDPEILKRPRSGTKAVHGKPGETVAVDDVLVSWCGIFATWAHVAGGLLPAGAWPAMPGKLTPDFTRVPQPGDILNMPKGNHFGLLTWVEAPPSPNPTPAQIKKLKIRSVEGNLGVHSTIEERSGTMADWPWGARNPDDW